MRKLSLIYTIGAAAVILLMYLFAKMSVIIKDKDATIVHLQTELAKAQEYVPAEIYTVRDSITVAKKEVAEVVKKEYKKVADKKLIKDIGGDISNVETQTKISTSINDTIKATLTEDSVFEYKDPWANIRFDRRDTLFTYNIIDSAVVYVSRIPKHKFLWWKWGVKGYDIKVACMNPHATIRHVSCIKIK